MNLLEIIKKPSATFALQQPATAGAIVAMAQRAILFGDDFSRVFDFFRRHRRVTLVAGASPFNAVAAKHLAENLAHWGVQAHVVAAADVQKAKRPEWASKIGCTWSESFDLPGPCILLGSPDDNPIIAFLTEKCVAGLMTKTANALPYMPVSDVFPGRGRGLVAWQIDAVGHDLESLTCVAYDAEGMREAVGTLFEAASGLQPLTDGVLPASSRIAVATASTQQPPPLQVAWSARVPDRASGMARLANGGIAIMTFDGTLTALSGK